MKLDDFINTYLNTQVDYDGTYGYQCVDLFRMYCATVLNIEHTGSVEGAKDLFLKYNDLSKEQKYFERLNSTYTMNSGDVVIWNKTATNKYGHVAIFLGYVSNDKILVIEQNGFTQEGCKISIRNIDNCLGFLRFKNNGGKNA